MQTVILAFARLMVQPAEMCSIESLYKLPFFPMSTGLLPPRIHNTEKSLIRSLITTESMSKAGSMVLCEGRR